MPNEMMSEHAVKMQQENGFDRLVFRRGDREYSLIEAATALAMSAKGSGDPLSDDVATSMSEWIFWRTALVWDQSIPRMERYENAVREMAMQAASVYLTDRNRRRNQR